MKPLIAIHPELSNDADAPKVVLPVRYCERLEAAGAAPLVLPPLVSEDTLRSLFDELDGLLLAGGDDFDTQRLGLGPTHPAAKPVPTAKQDFDVRFVELALEHGLPVLGVCYGMQLLGLTGGGHLHQHLPEDRPRGREHRGGVMHPVHVRPESKLASLTGVGPIDVVSRHHQALSDVGSDWIVSATDEEGLIEAIERPDHPFALGVQWHPELSDERSDRALLEGLVAAATEARRTRTLRTPTIA